MLPDNYQIVQKTTFLTLKIVKMTIPEGQILTKNFDFGGHIPTFRAENTAKIGHFKFKNNALTHPEQLQNNFEKVPKIIF